ncbi:hypothetical protein C5167_028323 [Papaver somniferum]|nr:hypothetical protein C5167_028323 [Papaver somniferum]
MLLNLKDLCAIQDSRAKVIQAWYMDESDEDQRLPHHREPKEYVSFDRLNELGVLSWNLDADNYETDEELKKIRAERGYTYVDFCTVCPEKMPNYDQKIKDFFEEHLHTDEEIRYCVDGSGYFDVRDENEKWIRVWVKKGGMIVLPAGMYHRFTLDTDNYIKVFQLRLTYLHCIDYRHRYALLDHDQGLELFKKHVFNAALDVLTSVSFLPDVAMRLFVGEPVWTPYNRPHDELPARKEYLDTFINKESGNHAVTAAT